MSEQNVRDLPSRRQAYLVRNSDVHPGPVYQAHRAVRNAAAVAAVLGVGNSAIFDLLERLDEALTEREYAVEDLDETAAAQVPAVVVDAGDVPVLLDSARGVRDALRDGVDGELRPRGPVGARIIDDIERDGDEAVFERLGDGTVSLGHDRLTLNDLLLVLDDLIPALEEAVARGLEVALLEDPGWHVGYYGLTPEERR